MIELFGVVQQLTALNEASGRFLWGGRDGLNGGGERGETIDLTWSSICRTVSTTKRRSRDSMTRSLLQRSSL